MAQVAPRCAAEAAFEHGDEGAAVFVTEFERRQLWLEHRATVSPVTAETPPSLPRAVLRRVFVIVLLTTALAGFIFQSTTFSLPKVFDERLAGFATSATELGAYGILVFAVAAFAQLVVGYLVVRYALRRVFFVVALLQLLLFAAMIQLSELAALLVVMGFMLAVFGEIPITDVHRLCRHAALFRRALVALVWIGPQGGALIGAGETIQLAQGLTGLNWRY